MEWFLRWGWAVLVFAFVVTVIMMLYRGSVSAWNKARGEWKVAALLEVGPFITFAIKVVVGTTIFAWGIGYAHSAVTNSPVANTIYSLTSAGVQAMGGTLSSYDVSVPEAPSLVDSAKGLIPSESDVRGFLGVPDSNSASTGNESVAPASNWTAPQADVQSAPVNANAGAWAPSNVVRNDSGWGNAPVMGPQPKPVEGPAPRPTVAPAPTQGPAPAQWNIPSFGGSGGPLAADADVAVANVGTYVVKGGDTLSKISVSVYGNHSGWARICSANHNKLPDCNNLRAGMVLQIP